MGGSGYDPGKQCEKTVPGRNGNLAAASEGGCDHRLAACMRMLSSRASRSCRRSEVLFVVLWQARGINPRAC